MKMGMSTAGPVPFSEGSLAILLYYVRVVLSPFILASLVSYGLSVLLWLAVLSVADLSLVRPLVSIGYLVTLFYGYLSGENVTFGRIAGTLLIIGGVYLVTRSAME